LWFMHLLHTEISFFDFFFCIFLSFYRQSARCWLWLLPYLLFSFSSFIFFSLKR
jgi:hypothetical protein